MASKRQIIALTLANTEHSMAATNTPPWLEELIQLIDNVTHDPDRALPHCSRATDLILKALNPQSQSKTYDIVDHRSNVTLTDLKDIFQIDFNPYECVEPWCLGHNAFDVPQRFHSQLKGLWKSFYCEPDTSSRVSVDDMLFQCCLALQEKLGKGPYDGATLAPDIPETSRLNRYGMILFSRLDLSVDAIDRFTNHPFTAHARADWAFGYGPDHYTDGNIVVVVQAKEPSEFSMGENQLLACLGIIREQRRKEGKSDRDISGFWTDGKNYRFMRLPSVGAVVQSKFYDVLRGDLAVVFNFITTLFEEACTVHPTSPQ